MRTNLIVFSTRYFIMWDPFGISLPDEAMSQVIKDERRPISCFECDSDSIAVNESEGVMVCQSCGVVLCNLIDKQSDQTSALAEGSSINIYLPKSSLGTSISGACRMKIRLVNEWWKWVYKEKSFYDDKREIESRCHKASLTQAVIDNALNLYKRVSESRHSDGKNAGKYVIIRGTNRRAIMAASVYYGAKLQRQPRCPKEISTLFDLEMGQMTKGCKRFLSMVDLSLLTKSNEKNEGYDYVHNLCHRLNLGAKFKEKSLEVIANIQKLQLATNHQPPAVAASTILLVMEYFGDKPTKSTRAELSSIYKVSDITINKTFKELFPWIRIITNTDLSDAYVKDTSISMLEEEVASTERLVL